MDLTVPYCTSQLLAVLSEILPFGNKFLDVMCGTEATVKFPVQLIGTRHSLHINVQDMGSERGDLHQSAM